MTISVNDVVTRVELPLSGRSSELYSSALGWEDSGTYGVLVDGWKTGGNTVVVGNQGGENGIVAFAADFVGMGVQW